MENQPLNETPQNSFNSMSTVPSLIQPISRASLNISRNENPHLKSQPNVQVVTADNDSVFVCNICLDTVKDKDPVVTQCGHLYCWACLFRWLNTSHTTCPVCKAGVTQDNVIPIFIRYYSHKL